MVRIALALIVIAGFFSGSVYADVNDAGVKVPWGYSNNIGPTYWGQLNPSFVLCAKGKTQSPVNITKQVTSAPAALTINYLPAPLIIVDDGQTDLMIGSTQTLIQDGHGIQLNFSATDAQEYITLNGKNYRLVELHFHSPSENQISGQAFPMEIHFVHQGDNGELAVIGVLVKGGDGNANIQKLIEHLPKEKGKPVLVAGVTINPADLIPTKRDYYSFIGSLTTPPCSEGVQWVLMAEPISASSAQIVKLRKAMGSANARPIQALNGRIVSFAKGE